MGLWTSGRSGVTITEDQAMFILPLDREIEHIYYNQRIVLDNNVLTEPRCWRLSKINRLTSNGVAIFTCAQDKYNPNADYMDEEGYWWADYYDSTTGQSTVTNEVKPIDNVYGVITCAGTQSIKVHGSFKKFTISYFNGDESIEPLQGNWHFYIQGQEISHLINVKTEGLQPNEVKVKFIGEPIFIGQLLTVRYIPRIGDAVELTIPVVSL